MSNAITIEIAFIKLELVDNTLKIIVIVLSALKDILLVKSLLLLFIWNKYGFDKNKLYKLVVNSAPILFPK